MVDISSAYNIALETDSFKVHNDFLNILLEDHSVMGMERHYVYFNESNNSDLKRILGNGFLKRGDEGVSFLLKKLNSHPLKTIFQHKACTDKLYADSFHKVQKNSHSSFEVICCRS